MTSGTERLDNRCLLDTYQLAFKILVMMKKNLGLVERIVRILFAVIVAVLYFTDMISGTLAIVLGVVAAIFLLTGLISFCPIWSALGISTLLKPKSQES
ncbi:MAG: DUF2892 domain-containing protein [Bacteroidota bacterium]